mmetsp:Transcript_11345/g.20590  ORF Transcript_11345/g.20590 Transcript_11345/m.20590 type:complete len:128 (-) Transcript_11345:1263-1646(-)
MVQTIQWWLSYTNAANAPDEMQQEDYDSNRSEEQMVPRVIGVDSSPSEISIHICFAFPHISLSTLAFFHNCVYSFLVACCQLEGMGPYIFTKVVLQRITAFDKQVAEKDFTNLDSSTNAVIPDFSFQ